MIDLAIKAKLPIIVVHTTDTLNAKAVIEYVLGKPVEKMSAQVSPKPGAIYMKIGSPQIGGDELYPRLVKQDSTMIVVNPEKPVDNAFNAGALPVPKGLIKKYLAEVLSAEKIAQIMPALGGLTIRECVDIIRLTSARDSGLSADGLMKTRRSLIPTTHGLTQVDLTMPFYYPDPEFAAFVEKEKPFFLSENIDQRLVPRGFLGAGPPGVGKTSGAKYLAREWGVPLYRLDLATVKGKYVGQSEAQLAAALSQADHEEPCVLLLDEIEKLFGQSQSENDHGVTTNMLSQVLWWLQEHTTRVFTIMTTNNEKRIPPELIRPGRLDQKLIMAELSPDDGVKFVTSYLKTFGVTVKEDWEQNLVEMFVGVFKKSEKQSVSHASATKFANDYVKYKLLEKIKLDQNGKADSIAVQTT